MLSKNAADNSFRNQTFYKITREDETHNGLKCQTGLVVDPEPWNPRGSCEPGGIYFTTIKNILAFLWIATKGRGWVREVTLPPDAKIYKNPAGWLISLGFPLNIPKWKADKIIMGKRYPLNLRTIKMLVKRGADIHIDERVFEWASMKGYSDILKYLKGQA